MRVHLINPNHLSFGIGVITPRWLYVIAAATPREYGDPVIVDETLTRFDAGTVAAGDVVGIGIHSGNAHRAYEVGRLVRERGGYVVFGGIHTSLYPQEPFELGGAHAIVTGDGDLIWSDVLSDCVNGRLQTHYKGGRIPEDQFLPARWELIPPDSYMWASVQTVRGCPKHCSFCSVWRTDGQKPRQRLPETVVEEIWDLRRRGFRFVVLADDNFYSVTVKDLELARSRNDVTRLAEIERKRRERFQLMTEMERLPEGMVFFTQITMEAADDPEFLEAMCRAGIKGALVGIESVTPEGLKSIFKEFNCAGEELVRRLRTFRRYGIHVLGSFIFGLPTDRPETFRATVELAQESGIEVAQFVLLTPFPGTVDFDAWEKKMKGDETRIDGIPLTRYWLIPQHLRPKMYIPHPVMSSDEIRSRTQWVWDEFYRTASIWRRSRFLKSLKSRLAFVLLSKLYRQMYANTGIATDSARVNRAASWARWLAKPCRRLFQAPVIPGYTARPVKEAAE